LFVASVIAASLSANIFCRFSASISVKPRASASALALAFIVAMVFSRLSPLIAFSVSNDATLKALSLFSWS
jgi:hypothetical protein